MKRLCEIGGDRLAQRQDADRRRIAVMAVAQRLDRRLDDEIRRAEIRLADAEIDDVAALRGKLRWRARARRRRSPRRCDRRPRRFSAWRLLPLIALPGNVRTYAPQLMRLARHCVQTGSRSRRTRIIRTRPVSAPETSNDQGHGAQQPRLRSQLWFDNPDNPGMTALYLERYLNYGLTREELHSGKPIIGIAQTGSDSQPCNRHHLELAKRVREGIRDAGGIAFEFPVHPDPGDRQAADRRARPQPRLSRPGRGALRLSARRRGADDRLRQDHARLPHGGGDRQHPGDRALRRADAERLRQDGKRAGSGTVVWQAREDIAAGKIDYKEFIDIVASSAPSVGHCNTMGTASTMNALAEALGMSLPGCAAIPAPYRERGADRLRDRPARRRDGAGGSEALRHPHPRGIRERDRRLLGDRRLDQRADPHQRHRPAYRRRRSRSRTGRRSATTCRSSSTCSRPANISARNIIAPAGCRR